MRRAAGRSLVSGVGSRGPGSRNFQKSKSVGFGRSAWQRGPYCADRRAAAQQTQLLSGSSPAFGRPVGIASAFSSVRSLIVPEQGQLWASRTMRKYRPCLALITVSM